MENVGEAVQFGKLDNNQTNYIDFDEGDTLGPGKKEWLFRHQRRGKDDQREVDRFVDFIDEHLAIEVAYCSVLNECQAKCSRKGFC